ncbi:T9SS type A sorting domain-containing protein [Hymenobacter sp. UYP22]|uniref:T9SS type A sorting domain-containing protein n=1 Tax=Hymenobacter sp. UYP22 TaxID=3156348 RepID=UPI0033979C7A
MKTSTILGCLLVVLLCSGAARAQTTAVAQASAAPTLITDKMADPTPNTNALKVRLETNPLTKRLTVRTDATGPTRVEVNGTDGRPVLTRDLISGDAAAVLDVSNLPAGTYIVQCTAGERRGMKRVMLGQ